MPKCYFSEGERKEILYLADQVLSPLTARLKTFVHTEKCYGTKCPRKCSDPKVFVAIQLQGCIPASALDKLISGEVEDAVASLLEQMGLVEGPVKKAVVE